MHRDVVSSRSKPTSAAESARREGRLETQARSRRVDLAYHCSMSAKRVGGCQCGAVRYEVRGKVTHQTLCHCTFCRRASAAPVVAWFSAAPHAFLVTAGELRTFSSSPGVVRSFCGNCGTPLTYQRDGLHEIDVTTCSLDDPESEPPLDHTFTQSALVWAPVEDGLPRHRTLRQGPPQPSGKP